MSEFMINTDAAGRIGREIAGYEKEINQIVQDINQVRRGLGGSLFLTVRSHLGLTATAIQRQGKRCTNCGNALTEISALYRNTENKLLNGEGDSSANTSSGSSKSGVISKIDEVIQGIRRRIDEMIRRWKGERTVEPYEVDSIVFDDEGTYGGDQGSARGTSGEKREQIYEIIRQNYPGVELTNEQLNNYLAKMNNEGCGYVALANTVFVQYEGREAEFEETFGYPMYDENGDLNYDLLIADLYSSTDNRETAWGEIDYENDYVRGKDGAKDDYDYWNDRSGTGSSQYEREAYLESFMEAHGCDVEVKTDANVDIYNYQRLSEEGKQVIIAYRYGNLYNMDGTVKQVIDGGHAMVVTGVTEDGKFIVSSWGEQYYIDPYETIEVVHDDGSTYQTSMTFSTVEYK